MKNIDGIPTENNAGRISTFREKLWKIDTEFRATRNEAVAGRLSVPGRDDTVSSISWKNLIESPQTIFATEPGSETKFRLVPDKDNVDELDLDIMFVKKSSSKLLVMLHGALDRGKYILPRLEYKNSLKDFDGSILFVQDPTLYSHNKLSLGWYIGTEVDDGHLMLSLLIEAAQRFLVPEKLVIAGSSGGGFASLAVSARVPGSVALVFSPQTSIEGYHNRHRTHLISSAFPNLEPSNSSLQNMENRLDMGALYSKTAPHNRVLYVQNTGDAMHMEKHCIPFVRSLGLDFGRGQFVSDRLNLECRFLAEGHRVPRPPQLREYVKRVFEDHNLWT